MSIIAVEGIAEKIERKVREQFLLPGILEEFRWQCISLLKTISNIVNAFFCGVSSFMAEGTDLQAQLTRGLGSLLEVSEYLMLKY